MPFVAIRRKTKKEKRFTKPMGMLSTKVTYIQKVILGIPFKTLHKYRQTYYGEVKECTLINIKD